MIEPSQISAELMREIGALLARPTDPFRVAEQAALEVELERFFGVAHAVVVSSGTAAIHCALAAIGVGHADQVLVPALCVPMSIAPVFYQGAIPVVVDSPSDRVDFDARDLAAKMNPRVKAVMPVYMWGCSYDIAALHSFANEHGLPVVEDACQAHGSTWSGRYLGTLGTVGCFSMKDGKLLATGEGGFLLTHDGDLAARCRAIRSHWLGASGGHTSAAVGWNYRLTELQALIARRQLDSFEEVLSYRRAQTEYVANGLRAWRGLVEYSHYPAAGWNRFSPLFLLPEAEPTRGICKELARRGIENSVGTFGFEVVQDREIFLSCVSRQEQGVGRTPNARKFIERVIALNILPHYTEKRLDEIIQAVKTAVAGAI